MTNCHPADYIRFFLSPNIRVLRVMVKFSAVSTKKKKKGFSYTTPHNYIFLIYWSLFMMYKFKYK